MYEFYRCPPIGDCPRCITISADVADHRLIDAAKGILAGVTGTASTDGGIDAARAGVDGAENELDAAVRAFSGLDDVEAAREGELLTLAERRDLIRAVIARARFSPGRGLDRITVEPRK